MLIAKAFAIRCGVFNFTNAFKIGLFNNAIPVTHPKLNKNPTSKMHKGLVKNTTIPANEIDVKLSYSLPNIPASINTNDIMLALMIDIEYPHRYA